jgi:uncharacterized protein (DUF2141 family)
MKNSLRSLRNTILASAVLGTLALSAGRASAADLSINIVNARIDQGNLLLALYDAEDAFMAPGKARASRATPVKDGKGHVVFSDLPEGRYAVTVFHDENGNGKMDMNVAGIPLERYGFSNDAFGNYGPPSFEQAAVAVKADKQITITLR